jgi:hypothetical protein
LPHTLHHEPLRLCGSWKRRNLLLENVKKFIGKGLGELECSTD